MDAVVVGRTKLDGGAAQVAVVLGVGRSPLVGRQALLVPDALDVLLVAGDEQAGVVGVVALGDPVELGGHVLGTGLGDEGVDGGDDLIVVDAARQAAVDESRGAVGHDVGAGAALDHADVGGHVVDDVADTRGMQAALGDGLGVGECRGLLGLVVAGNLREALDVGEDLGELLDGVLTLVVARAAVAGDAGGNEGQAQDTLLADLDGVVAGGLTDDDGVGAVGVAVVAEPRGAAAGDLLVAHDVEPDVAAQLSAGGAQKAHGEHEGGQAALHVGGAAAEDLGVGHSATERVEVPAVGVAHGHDVHMAVQDDAETVLVAHLGQKNGILGVGLEHLRADALGGEPVGHELHGGMLVVDGALVLDLDELGAQVEEFGLVVQDHLVELLLRDTHVRLL